ncbi:MAG: oligosaccharide flippase family protein [Candidatus Helarchaeota archaeon]
MVQRSTKGLEKTEVSQNSIFILAQIAITSLLGIFNSILLIGGLSRYYLFLGEDIYGRMGFIQNIVLIFTPFLYLGFLLTLTKKVAEHYATNDEYSKQKVKFTTQFAFLTISSITVTFYIVFTFLIMPTIYQNDFFNQVMPFYFGVFGLVWIINIISTVATGVLQGFQKYNFVSKSAILGTSFITISYLFLAISNNLSLLNVAVILLISELLKSLIVLFYMLYLFKNFEISDAEMNLSTEQKANERKELMKTNSFFILLNIFHIFIFYYDKILIYMFTGSYSELAYYFLANYIFTFLFPISCAIFNALLPASSEQNILENRERLVKYVNYGSKYAIYISAILAIIMSTIIAELMPVLYGDIGYRSVQYLAFFAIILVFETMFSPLGNVMIGISVRDYALIYSLRAGLNIILWPLLFYVFNNIFGILVGSIISSLVWYIVGFIYLREYIDGNKLLKIVPKALIPSILIIGLYLLCYFTGFFVSTSFIIFLIKLAIFGVGICVFFVICIGLMRGFTQKDINILERGIKFIPGSRYIIIFLKKISRLT